MDIFPAPDYSIARFLLERGLAAIYLLGFLNVLDEFRPLLGEQGLLPVPAFVARVPFRRAPSLFQLRYSDRLLVAVGLTGTALAAIVVLGLASAAPLPLTMLIWLALWLLYLSVVNVGQDFYAFGWESLLLEAGFLAIFLGNAGVAPQFPVLLLYRWLAFRLEFGAGLIKLRGDPCWRALSCMNYHHETQPLPNPLSWFFHRLPGPLHRLEAIGNFAAQLVMPFGLFLPQPIAGIAAAAMIVTQAYLVVSGNYAWLNWITIVVAVAGLPDGFFQALLPLSRTSYGATPAAFAGLVLALTVLVVVLSYWPARNLLSRRQLMNAPFNPLHLVNAYGAFGSVSRERYEVVVEGTAEATVEARVGAGPRPSGGPGGGWQEYGFRAKPTDPGRLPPQVAPYHLRLDWLMWFAALSSTYAESWFLPFMVRLLENDPPTLRLLRHNPFPGGPAQVRARLYRYHFATWQERRRDGVWWTRELVGEYLPPIVLRPDGRGAREPVLAGRRSGPRS